MKKKVLEISVRSDIGGGPKHLLDLLTYNESNCELYSAIPYGYEYSDEIISKSNDTINIPHRRFSIVTFFKIIKFCKKNKIQYVHSHGRGAGYYSRLMKLFGFNVIHTMHGVHTNSGIISSIKLIIDNLLKNLTDKFICISNGEMLKGEKLKVLIPNRTQVIFNGVTLKQLAKNELKSNNIKIAMLGRLSYPKGFDLLIPHVESFCISHPEVKFKINIAGDGEDKLFLKNLLSKTTFAKEVIEFTGQTSNPIMFLKEHTHFLSFARFEGMPLSVLEAMSVGLPCMVTDVVGNNDIINEKNGITFSLKEFSDKFLKFLNENHEEKTKQALLDISEKYNIRTQVNLITNLY